MPQDVAVALEVAASIMTASARCYRGPIANSSHPIRSIRRWRLTISHRCVAGQLGAAQRALARDLQADRRELSGDRRAGRLAQSSSRILPMTLSPASVRNVMPDLEHLGLVYAPHTSAGRLPTETRPALLRRCADADRRSDRARTASTIEAQVARLGHGAVARHRADRSLGAAVRPHRVRAGVVLDREVERAPEAHRVRAARAERALVVLVAEDGQVENRVLNLPAGLPTSALTEASNFLNARIRGRTLAEARAELERGARGRQGRTRSAHAADRRGGLASWSGGESDERKLIVRGHANLLDDLHALEDLERVRLLFDDLETKRGVVDLLGRAERAEGVRIFIGSENKLFSLSGSSTIIAPYRDSSGPHRRRHRRHRPDPAQLCAGHPDGRLHRQGGEPDAEPLRLGAKRPVRRSPRRAAGDAGRSARKPALLRLTADSSPPNAKRDRRPPGAGLPAVAPMRLSRSLSGAR